MEHKVNMRVVLNVSVQVRNTDNVESATDAAVKRTQSLLDGLETPERAVFVQDIEVTDAHETEDTAEPEMPIRIHVSDWNFQDKCYDASRDVVREFKAKILGGELVVDVWAWFIEKIDGGTVKRVVGVEHADRFFDYNNPTESVEEWE